MYNGAIVNELLKDRGITKKEFINSMGWSTFSQYRQFVNGNPTAKLLERAADFFQVSTDTFFQRECTPVTPVFGFSLSSEDHSPNIDNQLLQSRIDSLEHLIDEKDKRILLLERLVAALEHRPNTDSSPQEQNAQPDNK